MYCSTMWYNCTITAIKKLKISYNNSLRRLLNIPKHDSAREMFVHLNTTVITDYCDSSIVI